MMELEDHHRNFKFSNNKTFVTACNDSLNANTLNVNFVCVTWGKCVFNDNHDLCVLHYIHGVNSRTKKPTAVPISTREPKRTVNQSGATPHKRAVAPESTIQKPRSRLRNIYENVRKTCKGWHSRITPRGYKWVPKAKTENMNKNVRLSLGIASRLSRNRSVGIKRLLDDLEVTAAKLVMLVQKLLLLVLKVNVAGIKVTTTEILQLLKG
ncbi:hypothetical protein Tco_1290211 [Tanacetum coccineum]